MYMYLYASITVSLIDFAPLTCVVPKDEYSTSIATKRSDPCHVSPVPSKRKSCCVSIFLYGVGSLVCVPFLYIIEDHVSFTTKELFFFFLGYPFALYFKGQSMLGPMALTNQTSLVVVMFLEVSLVTSAKGNWK